MRSYQIRSAGADEAKERTFNNIRAKAAETVVVASSASTTPQPLMSCPCLIKGFASMSNCPTRSTASSTRSIPMMMGRSVSKQILTSSSAIPDAELEKPPGGIPRLRCRGDETRQLERRREKNHSAVGHGDHLLSPEPPLFSYDGLCLLTKSWFNQPDISNSMCGNLEAASSAEANGDLKERDRVIQRYKKQVKSQSGATITRSRAKLLITLAGATVCCKQVYEDVPPANP